MKASFELVPEAAKYSIGGHTTDMLYITIEGEDAEKIFTLIKYIQDFETKRWG